jgi:nucleoid-associated protein YgaU
MPKSTPKQTPAADESEQLSESYISIGLGLLVVVVVGILLYNYFTQKNTKPTETTPDTSKITEEATMSAKPGSTYTVVAGDTLWSISEKSYGTGYNWQEIAKANNLSNSDQLTAGQQLQIPEIAASPSTTAAISASTSPSPLASAVVEASLEPSASPLTQFSSPSPSAVASASPEVSSSPLAIAASPSPTMGSEAASITGTTYTIVRGDTLWDIACRAYGDCYQWSKIAQANKLENPNLIFAGNTVTLPR